MTEDLINDALINSLTHEQVDEIADQLMYNAVSIPFVFVQITGSWSAAALLGQIRWWTRKLKRSFYKTNEEFCSDLHMGINEFKAAKKRLIELGLIKTEVKGTPPKTYYFYDNSLVHRRIIELAENQPINRMASNSIGWNSTNQLAENQPITTYSTNINITPNKLKLICPLQGDDTPRDVAFDDFEEDILDNSGELAKSHQNDPKIKHNIYSETTRDSCTKNQKHSKKISSTKKPTQLPEDAELEDSWRDAARDLGAHPEWHEEFFEQFKNYWLYTATGKKALKVDWFLAWKQWVRKEVAANPRFYVLPRPQIAQDAEDLDAEIKRLLRSSTPPSDMGER